MFSKNVHVKKGWPNKDKYHYNINMPLKENKQTFMFKNKCIHKWISKMAHIPDLYIANDDWICWYYFCMSNAVHFSYDNRLFIKTILQWILPCKCHLITSIPEMWYILSYIRYLKNVENQKTCKIDNSELTHLYMHLISRNFVWNYGMVTGNNSNI